MTATLTDVTIPTREAGSGRAMTGVMGRPSSPPPWPGVVMIHEAWGLDDQMREHATTLAERGYLTLAPDLYWWGSRPRCMVATARAMARHEGRAFDDLEACRRMLVDHHDCTGRVGVLGFCMGGGFALLVAGRGYEVSSVNYGDLPSDLPEVAARACPVVASYGGRDGGRLRGSADRLASALRSAGIEHDVKEYPNAGHAFLNTEQNGPRPLRPLLKRLGAGPEPASAADAWRRIDAFLRRHLLEEPAP